MWRGLVALRAGLAGLVVAAGCGLSEYPHGSASPNAVRPPAPSDGAAEAAPAPSPGTGGREAGRGGSGGGAGGGGSGGTGGRGGSGESRDAGRDTTAPMPMPMPMPMPPVANGQVVIDGVPQPKEKVIVYLHLGHSNMAGRTSTPPELRSLNFEVHPRLWAYAKGGPFRPAKEPLSGDYLTRGGAGPGMSILHTGLGLAPGAFHVSIGRGHDGSIGGYCRNFRKGALMYDHVMVPAMELKGKVTFGAIFTMLGVNEFRRDAANLTRFNECLAGIASDMRGDLGDPEIPFLMGDWEAGATGAFDPTRDYAITTKAQLRIAEMKIPRAAIIPSDMLPMSDDHHYDLTGYKLWAERGFAIMKMKGWTPWASE